MGPGPRAQGNRLHAQVLASHLERELRMAESRLSVQRVSPFHRRGLGHRHKRKNALGSGTCLPSGVTDAAGRGLLSAVSEILQP